MSREQNVPLLLWISAALLAHIATGGGADRLARVLDDRAKLHAFADSVRAHLRGEGEVIEIDFVEDGLTPPQPEDPTPAEEEAKKPEAPRPPEEKRAEKAPEPEPAKAAKEAPAPTPPKQAKTEPTTTPTPPPPPQQDRRIAVRQHAKPDQEDNPNADYIADEANRVEQQTVAEITTRDQDDPNPTPGAEHAGPSERPGNSDEHRIADSEDRAGDPEKAPGEASDQPPLEPNELPKTAKADPPPSAPPKATQEPRPTQAAGGPKTPKADPTPPATEPPRQPSAPEVVANAESGGYRLDPGRSGSNRKKPDSPVDPTQPAPRLGLGLGAGSTPNGINLNLSQQGVVAAVGEDALSRERRADGERRRSAHRGSFKPSQFERWRAAIENYVSAVKPGNQTALNTARVPFATYLNTIHNRIHPIFADDFLSSLDGLPAGHPLNEPKLMTRLEIVLDQDDGRVVRMGVLRTSGVTAFDIAALDSVQRASPFGKPPSVIVSKDGNVYFHWEFHRNPMYACSTMHARPYMLTTPAPGAPEPKKPAPIIVPGGDPREQGIPSPHVPASREGSLPGPALAPSTPKRS